MAILTSNASIPIATGEAFGDGLAAKGTSGARLLKRIVLADHAVNNFLPDLARCAVHYFLATSDALRFFGVKVVLAEAMVVLGERSEVFGQIAGQTLPLGETDLAPRHQTLH
jgi:hypothetical protein